MNNLQIGLAFSGGGFRAASYSLGTLMYLDTTRLDGQDQQSLLRQVIALSTVSGGTITGARYALGISRGETMNQVFEALYKFLKNTDIVTLALDRLASDEGWEGQRTKSLINAFADVYDSELFGKAKFGEVMKDSLHLRHISFNATDFVNALQFRFQWTEKVQDPKPDEPKRGLIGNKFLQIDEATASEMRLADVLAASSCFPGGFEPINFPTDFFPSNPSLIENLKKQLPKAIGLMDGGIVDNQGISPLLLADQRMNRKGGTTTHSFDLLIIADVASPFMESFVATESKASKGIWNWSLLQLLIGNTLVLLGSLTGMLFSAKAGNLPFVLVTTILFTLSMAVYLLAKLLLNLPEKFEVPPTLMKPMRKLLSIKLGVYYSLVMNRVKSLVKLSGEVFLKHVRRLNYATLYRDPTWKNRRIMSAIYEAAEVPDEVKRVRSEHPDFGVMPPSKKIQEVANTAWSMGTTLWFTEEELNRKNMLDCLIATGQFTLCWNLLEYINRIKKDGSNTTQAHQAILDLEPLIQEHWKKFQSDPFWLLNKYQMATKS